MQTSHVLSQRTWFKVGDLDDCWVLSGIQAVHAIAPWLHLPSTTAFRAAAGDPDDGDTDGGNLREIVKGVEGVWPVFRRRLRILRAVPFAEARAIAEEGRPLSVALQLGLLPRALRYTTSDVPHQCTIVVKGGGDPRILFANPMAPAYTRWDEITWADVRPAIKAHAGNGLVNAVAFPTELEALALHPLLAQATGGIRAQVLAEVRTAIDALGA